MKAIKRVKAFQNIFDILLFATHATQPFTMKDLHDYVLDAPNNTIQCYVQELIKSGYLERTHTQLTRQLNTQKTS